MFSNKDSQIDRERTNAWKSEKEGKRQAQFRLWRVHGDWTLAADSGPGEARSCQHLSVLFLWLQTRGRAAGEAAQR